MAMYAAADTIILLRVGRRLLQKPLFSGLKRAKFNLVLGSSLLKDQAFWGPLRVRAKPPKIAKNTCGWFFYLRLGIMGELVLAKLAM